MNKTQKELLALIYFDLDCVDTIEVEQRSRYHFELAKGNLKDLMKELKIKEHGETDE